MINIVRTDSDNVDFIDLVKQLDAYLAIMDGNEHSFYDQFNKIDKIKHVVVAYEDDKPVGCGSIKEFTPDAVEVKRMYTIPTNRGKGVANKILAELETWAADLSYKKTVLETGKRLGEANKLYLANGYKIIPNYGQYIGIENSICFEKILDK